MFDPLYTLFLAAGVLVGNIIVAVINRKSLKDGMAIGAIAAVLGATDRS